MKSFKEFLGEDWRYKHPSVDNLLGITSAKKAFRKYSGQNFVEKLKPNRVKQRILQHLGIYGNPYIRAARQLSRGKLPSPFKFLPKLGDD